MTSFSIKHQTKESKKKLIEGSIIKPESTYLKLIILPCSTSGNIKNCMNEELYNLLSKKWLNIKKEYKEWYSEQILFKPGQIKTSAVQSDVWVLHCLFLDKDGNVDDKLLETCLKSIKKMALDNQATLHVSNMLLDKIPDFEQKLDEYMIKSGISVSFYFEPQK